MASLLFVWVVDPKFEVLGGIGGKKLKKAIIGVIIKVGHGSLQSPLLLLPFPYFPSLNFKALLLLI